MEIKNNVLSKTSSGTISNISGNVFTLKPSVSSETFIVESYSTTLTKIDGVVMFNDTSIFHYINQDFNGTWKFFKNYPGLSIGSLTLSDTNWEFINTKYFILYTSRGTYVIDYISNKLSLIATYGPDPYTGVQGSLNYSTIVDVSILNVDKFVFSNGNNDFFQDLDGTYERVILD